MKSLLSAKTCKELYLQASLLAQASRDCEGISLAAKTFNWPGLHKVSRKMAKAIEHDSHKTLKFIRDYGGDRVNVPSTREASCEWNGMPNAYEKLLALSISAQEGWKKIAGETSMNDTDANDYADNELRDGVGTIAQLIRWNNYFEQVGDDYAAWKSFDQERN